MFAFEIEQLQKEQAESAELYHEFLRVPSMSMGIYKLPAGSEDPQHPHNEDEVYCVLSGQASINVGGREYPVSSGSIVYVPAKEPHKFHTIEEDLTVLVFFAPAES